MVTTNNEYRIGNLLQDQNGNLLSVISIQIGRIDFTVVDRSKFPLPDGWKAQPIPLRYFELLQIGFVANRDCLKMNLIDRYANLIHTRGTDYIGLEIKGQRTYFQHIKYLHQLQNLVFDFTGKELEI